MTKVLSNFLISFLNPLIEAVKEFVSKNIELNKVSIKLFEANILRKEFE